MHFLWTIKKKVLDSIYSDSRDSICSFLPPTHQLYALPSQADAKRFKCPSVLGTFSSSTPPSATMTTSPSLWSLPIDASHLSNSLDSEAVLATKPGASNGSPLS